MDGAKNSVAARPERQKRRIAELIGASSIEISPRDKLAGEPLRDLFAPGTTIFVAHPPSATWHDIVTACARLHRAGFVAVPHIAARRLASLIEASDFLERAAGDANVAEALLIGGDPDWPAGPFPDSASLVDTGVVECHGFERIIFAGYPEGHPYIATQRLDAALDAKVALARRHGLEPSLVTQFGFDPTPIERWIAGLRARGITCPVRIGVAGPASVTTLVRFAVRCGVSASIRALARGHTAFPRILTEVGPDELIAALVDAEGGGEAIGGLHIFTFGGVARIAAWRQRAIGR
jgi:methylenetetrahydrofolate reductase (NADPH)